MRKRIHRDTGRFPAYLSVKVLRRRLASTKIVDDFSSVDVDHVVDRLRSQYPDYARLKLHAFTSHLRRALESLRSFSDADSPAKDDSGTADPSRKRSSVSSPEEDDYSTSTTDDAMFEAEVKPEFDLMKCMLRDGYLSKRPKPDGQAIKNEQDVVMEIADEKPRNLVYADGGRPGSDIRTGMRLHGCEKVGSREGRQGPRFRDFGGMNSVLEELLMEVIVPLCHPKLPMELGVRPMSGILLHGPPGCGKTKLAHAIANETGIPFYQISATEVVSGAPGASEENIRDLFKKAYQTAPSIVFIDEIDAIASKRENLDRESERRIVTQLMTCMDESHCPIKSVDVDPESITSYRKPGYVLIIGATNRPDALDPALRRPGRFDREIVLGIPNENSRAEILSLLTCNLKLEGQFNFFKIARSTPGFVGADLAALVNKAGNLAMKRIIERRKSQLLNQFEDTKKEDWWRQLWTNEDIENLSIKMDDFEEAVKLVQPSSTREGFSSIPDVKWEDVGGLTTLRKEFKRYVIDQIKHPEAYEEFGINLEAGFLLYGPPGCGKTLIAKAVANDAGANFIHIKGPELLNKFVGESELLVRTIFSRARASSPCILFFDEVDALTTKRGKEGGWVVERILNQLLIELDGSDKRHGVYVIGATNRPEVMDPAVLRPGRFGKVLYVPLPNLHERQLILKTLARKKPISTDVDLDALACRMECNNFSGADLAYWMNEAAMIALEEKKNSIKQGHERKSQWVIKLSHFEEALKKVKPSVSEEERRYYEELSKRLRVA